MQLGMTGLGRMGANMVRRWARVTSLCRVRRQSGSGAGARRPDVHDVDRDLRGESRLGSTAGGVRAAIQALGEKPLGPLANDGPLHPNRLSHVGLGVPSRPATG